MSDAKPTAAERLTLRRFVLLLGAAVLAAFPLVALGTHTFFQRDFGALGYPLGIFQREALLRGELPLWNPYSHCGLPFLAQMGTWYPPAWLCLFPPLPWAINFFTLLHLVWGGAGMFWLARRWGVGNFAASFAGFAFVFNGITMSCLLWGNYIASLAWLPWVVGCVALAWRGGGRWLALAAIASAMQVLTATPELTLLTWLFLGALWLVEVFSRETKWLPSLGRLVLVVALAAGITMAQMLPFFDLLAHSQRDRNYGGLAWAMPGWGWANLLVPLFHCYEGPRGDWYQTGQEFLASYYLGAGVLALGIAGAWLAQSRRAAVVAGMILFCWVMALGADGFLYERARKIFPLIGIARFPVKFAILPAFLLPLLAAWALEKIQSRENRTARRGFAVIAITLAVLLAGLVWFLRAFPFPNDTWSATATNAFWRAVILIALVVGVMSLGKVKPGTARLALHLGLLALLPLDALTHSPNIAPTLPSDVLAPGMWQAAGRPAVKLGEGRVMLSPQAEERLNYSMVADFKADFIGKRVAEWYNLNLLDSLPKVTGAMTLRPAGFDAIERQLYYTAGSRHGEGLLDFLAVQWLTSATNALEWTARTSALPVVTGGQKPVFASDAEILRGLMTDGFDPRAEVFLPEAARASVTVSNRTDCVVKNVRFGLRRVDADVRADVPGLVVLSQNYYHLWQAFVDEKPATLLRANLSFQAVQVPAGEHHLKLIYRDRNLVLGAVISLLSLAACAWIWWRGRII